MEIELDENQQNFENGIFSIENNHINQNSQNDFQDLLNIRNDFQNNYEEIQNHQYF
jgi:hypothetical protein